MHTPLIVEQRKRRGSVTANEFAASTVESRGDGTANEAVSITVDEFWIGLDYHGISRLSALTVQC